MDEFGPLEIRPYPGKGWFPKGKPQRRRADYSRTHGVRHLLAAYDLKGDKLYGHNHLRKTSKEFLAFLKVLRRRFHRSERLYIILDNFSPHKTKLVREWAEQNNVELVFTPTYSSWLNRIECHFAPLRHFVLSGSDYPDHAALADAIQSYLRWRNKNAKSQEILRLQKRVKVA
ncbi:IS630 family transposase [Heliophilum fasciatum]|uniref:Transposase n=1 Tax=Heliophilum fasciatum TaxID=35700 RepID=A0A4R2RH38_9FIRM|nr:IS630 family transposase [Heliophilum fasciatum]TCP61749.1 transposase [Heliophilum fasciatum]